MNRDLPLLALFLLATLPRVMAQVSIHDGTVPSPASDPHASAMLDVQATNKGVLVPRVDIANLATAAPVTAPAEGLLVYNTNGTTGQGYYYWNGTLWVRLMSGNTPPLLTEVDPTWSGAANTTSAISRTGTVTVSDRLTLNSAGFDQHLLIQRTGAPDGRFATSTGSWVAIWPGATGEYVSKGIVMHDNGNVGISTTNPTQSKLVVNGSISIPRAESFQFLESISGTFRAGINSTNANEAGVGFNAMRFYVNANNTTPAMVIGGSVSSGNVGIGTTAPAQRLDVNGVVNAASGYRFNNTNQTAGSYLRSNGTNFVPSGILAADLPSGSGNYIQNQTALQAASNFHISGNGRAVTSFQAPLYTRADAGTVGIRPFSNSTTAIQLQNAAGTSILNVDATNARVGIGTPAPTQRLHVNAGDILINTTSGDGYPDLILAGVGTSVNLRNDGARLWLHSNADASMRVNVATNYSNDLAVSLTYTPGTVGASAGIFDIGQTQKNNTNFTHGITRFFTNGTEKMAIAANGDISLTAKVAFRSTDNWLRLNPTNAFASGIYVANFFRVDGGISSGPVGGSGAGTVRATNFITTDVGFRVANAAATGTYLRGNGTNYVSSAIQAADIPTGSGNYIQNQTAAAQATANYWISGYGRANDFRAANGSAANPAFRFAGDTDNGMYLATSNTLAFSTAGAERMRIASNGNVGIGTTAPVQRLHLVGQMALNDNNTRIFEGSGNAVRVQTNSGYIDIGPQNTSWSHFQTDRVRFYFNKGITVDEGLIGSYDDILIRNFLRFGRNVA